MIISFFKIGPPQAIPQNNAFLCLIICSFSFWLQLKYEPFITKELNALNFKATLLMNLTIFLGLFASISNDNTLEIILLVVLFLLNFWFFLMFLKNYIILKIGSSENTKIIEKIKEFLKRFWSKGIFYYLILSIIKIN